MGGGGKSGGESKNETGPPAWAVPAWQNTIAKGEAAYNKPLTYFPDQTVAGFTQPQQQAQAGIQNTANAGSSLMGNTYQNLSDTMGGKYLSPESNPWLKGAFDSSVESSLPYFNSQAIQAGRYGSGAQQMGQGKLMAELGNQIYGGNYQAERARQMQAAGMAGSVDELARYGDYNKLAAVGEEQQAMNQALIDAEREKWNFGQESQRSDAQGMASLLSRIQGGTSVTTTSGGGK
jgi:hypothetical protein